MDLAERIAGLAGPSGRVLVVSADVGAGHDGAAQELMRRLRLRGLSVQTRNYLDALPRSWRCALREGYPLTIGYLPGFFEWLFQHLEHARWMHPVMTRFCAQANDTLARWAVGADVVVSTYPLASQSLGQLAGSGRLVQPLFTFLTDPAVHRLWVHTAVDHHVTVDASTARDGHRRYGVPMEPVGGLVPPEFGARTEAERALTRAALGLRTCEPMVLICAGSLGLGRLDRTVDAVRAAVRAQIVVLCGRNDRARLSLAGRRDVVALGWRTDVADLMGAADVLVHNAGGLSLTEAWAVGLPAVTWDPLPGHGRANADFLARSGLAPWPVTSAGLAQALGDVLGAAALRPRAHDRDRVSRGWPAASTTVARAHPPRTSVGQ